MSILVPFISIDGIDGTGKSTQAGLLAEWFDACQVPYVRSHDPGGTEVGNKLRSLLLDNRSKIALRSEALLFMAARAQLVEEILRPAVMEGKIVLSDRFTLANLVYQGYAGGLDVELLRTIGQFATADLQPSLVFILDMPVEEAQERRGRSADRLESRDLAFHEKVRQGFLTEAKEFGHMVIDARLSVEAIQAEMRVVVAECLGARFPSLHSAGRP